MKRIVLNLGRGTELEAYKQKENGWKLEFININTGKRQEITNEADNESLRLLLTQLMMKNTASLRKIRQILCMNQKKEIKPLP